MNPSSFAIVRIRRGNLRRDFILKRQLLAALHPRKDCNLAAQEDGGVLDEQLRILEQRTVSRVGVENHLRTWRILYEKQGS